MRPCDFVAIEPPQADGKWRRQCQRCGRITPPTDRAKVVAVCRATATPAELAQALELPAEMAAQIESQVTAAADQHGLLVGDVLASFTRSLGIPPCAGCDERRQWLNTQQLRLSAWLARLAAGPTCPLR